MKQDVMSPTSILCLISGIVVWFTCCAMLQKLSLLITRYQGSVEACQGSHLACVLRFAFCGNEGREEVGNCAALVCN